MISPAQNPQKASKPTHFADDFEQIRRQLRMDESLDLLRGVSRLPLSQDKKRAEQIRAIFTGSDEES
ncbi:MAG: hypothetical protein AAGF84_04935 [Planctomycetota bacterium]